LLRHTCIVLYAHTVVTVAGTEAEILLLPDRPSMIGNDSDVEKATFLSGFFPRPAAVLEHARADAANILAARRQVEAIARALLGMKTMSGAEIDDVLSVTPALRAERARRRRWAATVESAGKFGTLAPLSM
jgi:hypothetical protein